jgi:membrane protease subunit HflK
MLLQHEKIRKGFKMRLKDMHLSIVPEARGQAQARIRGAEAYKEEVVAKAEGEVEDLINSLAEYLKAPEVTRDRLYLDALQSVLSNSTKIMVDVEGGNNLLYLPLDKIMEENKKKGDDDE